MREWNRGLFQQAALLEEKKKDCETRIKKYGGRPRRQDTDCQWRLQSMVQLWL